MREGSKNKNSIYIVIIILITGIIMSAIATNMYFKLLKPEFYKTFIELGNKFLNESKYEETILEFEKAIHIEPKSTKARIGSGKAYICINEVDSAVDKFKEAQSIDIENTKLLLEILEILKDIDSESAYDILQNYIDKTQNTIPDNIKQIINNSNNKPQIPIINPVPGTYINPINIKLDLDKLVVGYTFYYTIDGSEPSKDSIKYDGGIDINKDTTIKLIANNHKGESSEVVTLEYFIDTEIMNKLRELIKESEELLKNIKVGVKIGNTTEGAKKALEEVITRVKKVLIQEELTYKEATHSKGEIEKALDLFNNNIIKPTDKSKLKNTIDKAQKIHDKSNDIEKNRNLLNVINKSKIVLNNPISKQEEIDNQINKLNRVIVEFEESIEDKILGKYFVNDSAILYVTEDKFVYYMLNSYEAFADYINSREIQDDTVYYNTEMGNFAIEPINSNSINCKYNSYSSSTVGIHNRMGKHDVIRLIAKKFSDDYDFNNLTEEEFYMFSLDESLGITLNDVKKALS